MPIPRKTRLQIAKSDIMKAFSKSPMKIFSASDIRTVMDENRDFWRLSAGTTPKKFIAFLLEDTLLKEENFEFPRSIFTRYHWKNVSIYSLVLSLRPQSYLSHYTAMYLHNLTEQVPKIIYVNAEQKEIRTLGDDLEQSRMDNAFKGTPKISKAIATYDDYKICLLYGKATNQLGVLETNDSEGDMIRITDVERTLIDITTRPFYAGGVFEVLKAFRLAKNKVSINKMAAYLKKIGHIYPYHQAIGFYLEKSGVYDNSQIDIFRRFEKNFDFYLTYQMKEKDYSKEWRLFYPKGM